ncbi:MAG: L,D-transpeptidase [Rhodobacteraceae bacterium]|jgi:lipoprotein-anchoring transpeptidase ErfK/SrfK|nr:L,D-transpeptidase [Paracoccaceae bacterium]
MSTQIARRTVLAGLAATAAAAVAGRVCAARAAVQPAPTCLAELGRPGVLPDGMAYLAPAALHAAYSLAVYVNTSPSGATGQRMWVLGRDGPASPWTLALQDAAHFDGRDGPADYSWPVSTGRKYPGDPRSGPTPLGIFNVDERPFRHRPGWGSPGMYNALYIDLHYGSGRVSGVAMHGTPRANYRLLGRPESHGCIRMTQANADALWARFHPAGTGGDGSPLWGEVPRFFRSAPHRDARARSGYVRDGTLLFDPAGALLTRPGYRAVFVFFRDDR